MLVGGVVPAEKMQYCEGEKPENPIVEKLTPSLNVTLVLG
jgi:hypothetical protein